MTRKARDKADDVTRLTHELAAAQVALGIAEVVVARARSAVDVSAEAGCVPVSDLAPLRAAVADYDAYRATSGKRPRSGRVLCPVRDHVTHDAACACKGTGYLTKVVNV